MRVAQHMQHHYGQYSSSWHVLPRDRLSRCCRAARSLHLSVALLQQAPCVASTRGKVLAGSSTTAFAHAPSSAIMHACSAPSKGSDRMRHSWRCLCLAQLSLAAMTDVLHGSSHSTQSAPCGQYNSCMRYKAGYAAVLYARHVASRRVTAAAQCWLSHSHHTYAHITAQPCRARSAAPCRQDNDSESLTRPQEKKMQPPLT